MIHSLFGGLHFLIGHDGLVGSFELPDIPAAAVYLSVRLVDTGRQKLYVLLPPRGLRPVRKGTMPAQPTSPPRARSATKEQKFEWLLCLAAALQACQRQQSIQVDEARHARPRFLNAMVRAWASRSRWPLALRRLQAWRKTRAQERDAA